MWSSSSSDGEPDDQTKHESFNDRHERREAIRDYWNLQDTPRRMLQAAERDGCSKEQLRNATLEAAKHAAGIGRYFSNQFSPLSYNEIRRDDVAIASRVMAMPELTEAILSYTSIPDILDVSQVSRSLKAIIEASPKLQRQLFLKPAESTSVVHTLTEIPFEDMTVERLGDGPDGETRLKVEVGIRKCKRVNIGSTRRRMLICQPPLKRIFVTSAFDECHVIFRNGHEELHSAAGLTVGDLYDKALELVRVDSPCRDCEKEHAAAQDGRRIRVDHECLVEFESSIKNSKSECYFEDQRRTRSRIHRPNQTFGERCTVGMDIERRESGGRRLWAWAPYCHSIASKFLAQLPYLIYLTHPTHPGNTAQQMSFKCLPVESSTAFVESYLHALKKQLQRPNGPAPQVSGLDAKKKQTWKNEQLTEGNISGASNAH